MNIVIVILQCINIKYIIKQLEFISKLSNNIDRIETCCKKLKRTVIEMIIVSYITLITIIILI